MNRIAALMAVAVAVGAVVYFTQPAQATMNSAPADPGASGNPLTGMLDSIQSGVDNVITKISDTIRGLRNNNPGNIRLGQPWQGMAETQTDPAFVQFTSPEYGIRAMNKILDSYASRGIVSVQGIIQTWAPPSDNNDTASYVRAVALEIGVAPYDTVTPDKRPALIAAIIKHENGVQPYALATIQTGVSMA